MRIILLAALLSGALTLTPEQCDTSFGDELEYQCQIKNSTVTFTSKQNDYVKILCEGPDITCDDIPFFDFAAGLPLKSLGVTRCPPTLLSCVSEHIAASALEIVTLRNMSAPLTEEHLVALKDVRMLMMLQAGAQTSFPAAVVTAIPSLRRLSIDGGHFQLYPNAFDHASPLKYLELSNDRIRSIPPDTFKGLGSLTELNLWANPIQNIPVGAFRGLDSLQRLSLSQLTNLSSIEAGVFSDTPLLGSLYLTANKLETIPNGLLQGLNQLENVTIQMNRGELTLDTEAFSHLPSLKKLIIFYTTIRHLPANLFKDSNGILKMQMNNDNIESLSSDVFLRLSSLKWLDLSFNKITVLPNGIFRGLRNLEYLNLNRNFIAVLPDGLFNGLIYLKQVHIDFNNISEIAFTALQGARNLHTLSLATNHLTLDSDNPAYQFVDEDFGGLPSPFNGLFNLVKLDLSHNKIRNMLYDWQAILLRLELLDLSYNEFKIIEFDNRATNFLSSKLTVDLRHNRIQTVILDKPTTPLNNTPSATLLLDDNPLDCDCSMYGLRIRLNGTQFARNEPKFVLENAKCSSPPELHGQLFAELSPDSLICELPEIPDSCTSCIAKVASNELVFDCRILPKLPDTSSPNISYYFVGEPTITVNLEKQPHDLGTQNVHTLNLSYTGIEHIDFRPTPFLKVLDVSHNELTSVPMEFLAANITLYMADNPIECECWYADDIAELQQYAFIEDLAQVTCANGDRIAVIDTTALCNTWKASVAAIGTFVTLAFIVLIAAMIIRRYSNEILVYMTTRGICKCCIKEVLLDKDKEYDVFISFAHQDLSLVEDKLLPMLENDLNQKVCVHYRDWIVGDMIPTQILRSVESSRRTIIILSKNFLESVWANLEFSAAHNLALQEGKARVILILLEESVSKHSSVSEELKAYIATNTYLLWNDQKFLEKLRKVLPKKKHTFTWIDALKHRSPEEQKVGMVGLDVQLNSDGKLVNVAKKIVEETLPHQFV